MRTLDSSAGNSVPAERSKGSGHLPAYRKVAQLLTRREKTGFALLLCFQVFVALIEAAGIASIMPFVALVTNPAVAVESEALSSAMRVLRIESAERFMILLGVLVLALVVVGNAAKATASWLTLRYENRLNCALGRRLLATYLAKPYSFFLGRNSIELGKNVLSEVASVVGGVIGSSARLAAGALVAVAIIVLLLVIDPIVAVVIAVTLGTVYALVFTVTRRRLARAGSDIVDANAYRFRAVNDALMGVKDVKVLGKEPAFVDRFTEHARRHARSSVLAGVLAEIPRYALETVAFGGIVAILLTYLVLGRGHDEAIPLVALYAFAGYRLMPAFQQVYSNLTTLRFRLPAAELLYAELGGVEEVAAAERLAVAVADGRLPVQRALRLQEVWFTYPGARAATLRGISIEVPANRTVAFVGPTGSGKTTTIDLILGLLAPDSGRVLADDVDIAGENLRRWQRNVGYVPQQIHLMDQSVRRNIAFGVPDAEIDDAAVERAARAASIHDFIVGDLAQGYETVIGDRGIRLSGGQRQRIGIARALYRDPAVLVFDEATSALDGVTEEAVLDALRSLSGSKTIVLIAHRLTTVQHADNIYLLDRGAIVASGTYEALNRSSEWFRAAGKL